MNNDSNAGRQISRLNLLVHPDCFPNDELFDLVDQHVESLSSDEVLAVLTNFSLTEKMNRSQWLQERLQKPREALGRRLVVVSGTKVRHHLKNTRQEIYQKLRSILHTRGFVMDSASIQCQAFGLSIGVCVPSAAQDLNEALGFSQKTLIRTDLTDARSSHMLYLDGLKRDLAQRYDRLTFARDELPVS